MIGIAYGIALAGIVIPTILAYIFIKDKIESWKHRRKIDSDNRAFYIQAMNDPRLKWWVDLHQNDTYWNDLLQ